MKKSLVKMTFYILIEEWLQLSGQDIPDEYRNIVLKLKEEKFFERCELMDIIYKSSSGEILSKIKNKIEQTSLTSYEQILSLKAFRACLNERFGISDLYERKSKAYKKMHQLSDKQQDSLFKKLRDVSERDALVIEIYFFINNLIDENRVRGFISMSQILSIECGNINYKKCTLTISPKKIQKSGYSVFCLPIEFFERLKKLNPSSKGFIFVTSNGRQISERHLRRSISRAAKKIGLPFAVSCLNIRRSHS
jgi:uncharacterized protein (UPF0262 family)